MLAPIATERQLTADTYSFRYKDHQGVEMKAAGQGSTTWHSHRSQCMLRMQPSSRVTMTAYMIAAVALVVIIRHTYNIRGVRSVWHLEQLLGGNLLDQILKISCSRSTALRDGTFSLQIQACDCGKGPTISIIKRSWHSQQWYHHYQKEIITPKSPQGLTPLVQCWPSKRHSMSPEFNHQ